MSEIHKALAIFGLEPGSSQDAIQRRYKRLIMVWHPDRFPNEDGKKDAEEELKKINNANDVFKKHFSGGHRASGCECQKPAPSATSGGTEQRPHGPGPGPQRKPDDAEAQAKQRDEERKRKAAAEEAARKAAEQQEQQQRKAPETNFEHARKQQEELKWNKIRWQIAAGEAVLFIALCAFGNFGYGVKEWWHKFSFEWERDHAPKQDNNPPPDSNNLNPYVPPYQVPPTNNNNNAPTNGSPFGPVGPPPSNNNSDGTYNPYSTLDELNKQKSETPTQTTTGTGTGFNWKPTTPDISAPSNPTTTTGTGSGFNWKPLTPGPSLNPTTTTGSPLFQPKNDWLTPRSRYENLQPNSSDPLSKPSQADLDKFLKPADNAKNAQ